jgi:hypothetical protein
MEGNNGTLIPRNANFTSNINRNYLNPESKSDLFSSFGTFATRVENFRF